MRFYRTCCIVKGASICNITRLGVHSCISGVIDLTLSLPYDVIDANDTDRLLLFVGDNCGLGLDPGVAAGLSEEAVLAGFALSLREHCRK